MKSSIAYRHWIRSAALFLLRSGRSTLALSVMVAAAVAGLVFLSAFAVGVNDAMVRNSVGLYAGHITAAALPETLKPEALQMQGVAHVLKRLNLPGVLSGLNQEKSDLAVTMVAVDPAAEQKATAFHRKIIHGAPLENGSNQVLLSRESAEKLGVEIGETLRFTASELRLSLDLKLSGIYAVGIAALDHGVAFCPADILSSLPESWSAAVFIRENYEPEEIISFYDRLWGNGDKFKSWKTSMPDLTQLIQLNYVSMGIVMVLVMGVVAVGIACTFIVFIFKSLREYGIMKAMGVTALEIAFLIVTEIVLITLIASMGGELLGAAAVALFSATGVDLTAWTSHNQYFAVSGVIYPRLTCYSLLLPVAVAFFFGLLASVWPALVVARKKAVDVLRSV